LLAGVLAALLIADQLFPPPLPGQSAARAQLVVARDGTPLRAFPDRAHIWRHPVRVEDVSPRYIEALITYEDRSFWWHPGVNPWALLRAAWQWQRHGQIVSGGSTLSMQVARLLEPDSPSRSATGKLRQIARALQLELRLSKREILEIYLTFAPMGGVVEGVEAASRAYLGKAALRLSESEAALLTVLPQAPSRLRPDRYPEAARQARDKVLDRLQSRWGAAVIADARQEPVIAQSIREPLLAPLLAERLRRLRPQVARIDSTIDASLQQSLEYLLAARLPLLPPRVSMAALVVDNQTLEVRAYAGSADFTDDGALCARGHGAGGALARFDPETLPLRPGPRRRIDSFRIAARRRAAVLLGLSAGQFPGQLQRPGQRLRSLAQVAQRAGGGSARTARSAALRFPAAPRRPEAGTAARRGSQSECHPWRHGGETWKAWSAPIPRWRAPGSAASRAILPTRRSRKHG
jgi:hypothetical protein